MKTLVPLTILIAGTLSGFSQGVVQFQNFATFLTPDVPAGSARLIYNVGSPLNSTTGQKLGGTNFVAELFVGAAGTTSFDSLTPMVSSITRFRATTSSNIGKWGTATLTGGGNASLDLGVNAGTVLTL